MADDATPKDIGVPKWAWQVLIALCVAILIGGAIGEFFPAEKTQITTPTQTEKQAVAPAPKTGETEKARTEEKQWAKFLVFVLLGVILLAIAFIPKLPGGKFVGMIGSLLLIFGLLMAATLWTWPKLENSLKPSTAPHASKTTVSQLPANAKHVKTLAPGEITILTCGTLELPPPQRWTRGPNGVVREPDWPAGAKSRGLRNTTNDVIELFIVLPPGQSLEKPQTATPPAKQLAQTTTDCLLDKAFGSK